MDVPRKNCFCAACQELRRGIREQELLISKKAGLFTTLQRLWLQMPSFQAVKCQTCGDTKCPHAEDHKHPCIGELDVVRPHVRYD